MLLFMYAAWLRLPIMQVLVAERGQLVMVANFSPEHFYESLKVRPVSDRDSVPALQGM